MRKYVDFIYRYNKWLTVLLVLIMVFMIAGIRQLNINTDFDIFKIKDSEQIKALESMEEIYGSDKLTFLIVEAEDDVTLEVNEFLDSQNVSYASPEDIGEFYKSVIEDEGVYYLTYLLEVEEANQLNTIKTNLDYTHYMSGDLFLQSEMLSLLESILVFLPPLALLLVLLIFRSQLSSFKATLLSVLPAGLSAMWTMGIIGWIGQEVSIITVLAPIFSIVIGSADGLHFITHMEEAIDAGKDNKASLVETLSVVGIPMVITTTTSVAGFIALMMINNDAIRSLAVFAALGVTLAGVITWLVLPLIFTTKLSVKYKEHKLNVGFLKAIWNYKSVVLVGLLLGIAVMNIPRISTEFNQFIFFKSYTDIQKSFDKITSIHDGAIPIYYYGQMNLNDLEEEIPKIQNSIQVLSESAGVKRVIAPLERFDRQAFDPAMLGRMKNFIRIEDNTIHYRFMVFPNDLKNETINDVEMTAKDLDGQVIGGQLLMKEMNSQIISGQVMSIGLTMILIVIMLLMSLRSIKLTLIALIPVTITTILLYGFLGMSQISLNLMTSTIFSISLGIGIDYAIHFVSVYKYYQKEDHALEQAFKYTSRPIIANAFGLSIGMSALMVSPLLIHMHISSLMWVAMISSVLLTLTIIPTILKKIS